MSNVLHSIGDFIVVNQSIPPQSSGAATVSGNSIDRFAHNLPLSCVLHQAVGAISGSPTSAGVSAILQHSPDNSNWGSYFPPNLAPSSAQTPALSSANTNNSIPVDLSAAMRFIRAQTVVTFGGGTSPAAVIAAALIIGGETKLADS